MEFPEKNGLIISAAFTATKILTLSLTGPRLVWANTDQTWNNNISKTVRVYIAFTGGFFKEYSINFLMIYRLINFALVVL